MDPKVCVNQWERELGRTDQASAKRGEDLLGREFVRGPPASSALWRRSRSCAWRARRGRQRNLGWFDELAVALRRQNAAVKTLLTQPGVDRTERLSFTGCSHPSCKACRVRSKSETSEDRGR